MDSITQAALGAVVGEKVLGKELGRKAPLWGLLLGTLPDLDILAGPLLTDLEKLTWHRGISHSIFFNTLLAIPLARLLRWIHGDKAPEKTYFSFVWWILMTHIFIDGCTTYGTYLLKPLYNKSMAFNCISIIDPLYTLPLIVGLVWAIFYKKDDPKRRKRNNWGLWLSTGYMALALCGKAVVHKTFTIALVNQEIAYTRLHTNPTILNTVLWRGLAETKDGYYVGFITLANLGKEITFTYTPKNRHLATPLEGTPVYTTLQGVSHNWYSLEPHEEGVLFGDLRFGKFLEWARPQSNHVFFYLLKPNPDGEATFEFRPPRRFREKDDSFKKQLHDLWRGIKGDF